MSGRGGVSGEICFLPYVWQLTETFKMQRSCIKMLSITRIRLVDVAVAALSSVEAVLIIDTEEESQRRGDGRCE